MYEIEEIKNKIICGDALKELKQIPNETIDMVITSPPYYGLRNYGIAGQIGLEKTFQEYLENILAITAEIKRVLKKSGSLWLNLGDSYGSHSIGASKSAGGIQKRLCQKEEGFPRYSNKATSLGDKCLGLMPERIAIAMMDQQGWILRNKIKWAKQILIKKENRTIGSVMPTSVKDRFNESGEDLYFFVKNKHYYSNLNAVKLDIQTFENRPQGIIRCREYGYDSKYLNDYSPQSKQSNVRLNYHPQKNNNKDTALGKNLPSIWLIQSEPHNFEKELGLDVDHFASFPQALLEVPIKFACPENGLILDPFMGSGTTAIMAKTLGRNFIGIELNAEYIKITKIRIDAIPPRLF